MSARAASRLETLGFRHVYRYQPGKADWFAAGLPREGKEAHTPRVADVARRVVLGLAHAEAFGVDPDTPVEQVMQPSPVTFRPNVGVGQMPDYLKTQRTMLAIVTTSDGVLMGLLRIEDVE